MVSKNIFRRQNRDDEETPLLTAEETVAMRSNDSPQVPSSVVDPTGSNIRDLVNRGRTVRNATVIDVEDETAPLLGRGSVRDNNPNPPQSVFRNRVPAGVSRRFEVLSNAADKMQRWEHRRE